jgi:hypothetical protein
MKLFFWGWCENYKIVVAMIKLKQRLFEKSKKLFFWGWCENYKIVVAMIKLALLICSS